MSSARYIGRVGALAVALGIGAAVANSPGLAYAEPGSTSAGTASDSSSPTGSSAATDPTPDSDADSPSNPSGGTPPETSVSSSGGVHTSTHGGGSTPATEGRDDKDAQDADDTGAPDDAASESDRDLAKTSKKKGSSERRAATPEPPRAAVSTPGIEASSKRRDAAAATIDAVDDVVRPTARRATSAAAVMAAPAIKTASVTQIQSAVQPPAPKSPVPDAVTGLLSSLIGALGFASSSTPGPTPPPESPLSWAMLAYARSKADRESSLITSSRIADTSGGEVTTTLALEQAPMSMPMAAAAVPNSAPVAGDPVVGLPAAATGVVTGSVGVTDPDGNALTYNVSGQPAGGKVAVDSLGGFVYTPTQAARLRAGATAGPDGDAFSVTVSDGLASTTVSVSVPVSPVDVGTPSSASTGGSNPAGAVVVPGKGVYVANSSSNTVTVLDATSGAVIKTIAVGGAPTAVAASADGSTVWVANAGSNSVSRINTATNAVVATTAVGWTPRSLVVAPDGSTVWAANAGSNTVSRISTATNAVVGSPINVGWAPYGISITPDGSSVFVANSSSNTVSRISTATNAVVGSPINVGSAPLSIAAFGDRVYTANQFANSVSVINTTTNVVTTVAVGANPTSVTLSPDGSLAYVANAYDTVSVIDTRTNAVIRTITIDTAAENGPHVVSVSPDGSKVYVTDGADGAVRILALAKINSAPVAGTPTVGNPDVASGAVTGSLKVTDLDGDALTYTVTGQPANGSTVTLTPAGGYTFTPSATARNLAAQPQGPNTASFTVTISDGLASTTSSVTVPVSPLAAPNRPPVKGTPSVGNPDATTGAVSGSLNVTDPDGNTLSYNVTGAPSKGAVTIGANGNYVYTPTAAARATATQTEGPDSDEFTVRVSDGKAFVDTTVTVPVAPNNRAPVAGGPVVGLPNTATGVVTGSMGVTDPDGNTLSYTVTGAPSSGVVVVDGSGVFTYTPTQAARLRAGQTASPDGDAFTVVVSDGVASTSVRVDVKVMPAVVGTAASWATGSGSNPAGVVVVAGKGVYVANTGKNTVSVLDPVTGGVVKTIAVGGSPTALVASADGSSVWVANTSSNTVSRINTTTNAVVATTQVGWTPRALAVSGSTLWVANAGSNTVSRINTATNAVVATTQVGWTPYGITVSRDGSQVYVTNRDSNSVTRISTTTNAVVGTITDIGPGPVAVLATAGRAYTVNYNGNYVAVFDTVSNQGVNMIPVGTKATSMAFSPDSSVLYVTNTNDTVTVIDVRSETVITTFTVDSAAENGTHSVAVSPDGTKIYVTDGVDGTVRVLPLVRGNTLPQTAITVGTPDWTTGVVTGSINATDADGDALSYTVIQSPANGSTVSMTPTGGFTFTPSTSARQLAAQSPTATFVVRVNDAGGGSSTATVTVTVAPALQSGVTPIVTGSGPSRVVVSNGKVYVLNYAAQTVSIINPVTNQVVQTINVAAEPTAGPATALAVRADGRMYVARYDSVQVIDTTVDQLVATVPIEDLCATYGCYGSAGPVTAVVINPSGTLVYAIREYYTDVGPTASISAIDAATNAVVYSSYGSYTTDLEWTPDGTRHYSAQGDYHYVAWSNVDYTGGTINIVAPGEWPYSTNVAISPDGRRTYAVMYPTTWNPQQSVTIAVIDSDPTSAATYNTQIASIALAGAQDIAFSADSARAYVTMSDGKTIAVINTATNTVIGSFVTDQNPTGAYRTVAVVGSTLYVTDNGDNTVWAVNLDTLVLTAV